MDADVVHCDSTRGGAEDTPCSVVRASLPVAAARRIEDLDGVHYPNGIASPNTELNRYARAGKFKYDRNFLLQFKAVCTEKPTKMRTICIISKTLNDHQAQGSCSLHSTPDSCAVVKDQSKKKHTQAKQARGEGTANTDASTRDASGHSASGVPPPTFTLGPTRGEKGASRRGGKIRAPVKCKVKDKKKTAKAYVSARHLDGGAGPSQKSGEAEEAGTSAMSEADASKKIDNAVKVFFSKRKLDEAEAYFSGLPPTYHHILVDSLVSRAAETHEADATLVADFFARAASKNLCSPASFEEGFLFVAKFVDYIAFNTPNAWHFMVVMLKGANLDAEAQKRVASRTPDADKLLSLLS
ncbi:hypothetical protein BDN71DRAFT_1501095 [Pleurotus eryngii]|uniref:MI domain-containing protein n=1 Tax=Pleurotus eryngii TaxID=5323 RepID=A0A9P6A7H0_PLEER|nr:hypothetical protein BDN71DRAFT_1501095 [Pleurotus eryngii]